MKMLELSRKIARGHPERDGRGRGRGTRGRKSVRCADGFNNRFGGDGGRFMELLLTSRKFTQISSLHADATSDRLSKIAKNEIPISFLSYC